MKHFYKYEAAYYMTWAVLSFAYCGSWVIVFGFTVLARLAIAQPIIKE
jgi:hypothetical protein